MGRPISVLRRVFWGAIFVCYFAWEVVAANARVALEIITPNHLMHPGILAIPLDVKTDLEIVLLSSLISLTPGSLVLDVSTDKTFMYVHVMYLNEPEDFKKFEARLLRVLR